MFAPQPASAQAVTGLPTNLTPGSYSPDIFGRISQNGTKIAYTAKKGNFDLSYTYDNTWVMNTDGSAKSELEIWAYFGGSENQASVSPDGKAVALVQAGRGTASDNGLFMATVDPYKQTQLNTNVDDRMPVWTSDGTKIAFLRQVDGMAQVFVMKAQKEDSSNVAVQLTNWFDGPAVEVAPTTDGKLLVVKKISDTNQEIYLVNPSSPYNDVQVTSLGTVISSPSQAKAGGPIFFLKAAKDGKTHVFSIKADGTGLHQVTGGAFTEDTPSAGNDKLVVTITNPANGAGNQDIAIYTLSDDTTAGTVSGTFTSAAGAVQAGTTVNAYDGDTLKATTTTDASGKYSLSLPPGGYTLEFVTADAYTVTRSIAVAPGGSLTQDAFTTPTAAPRPGSAVATIRDNGNVAVRWAKGNNPSGGYAVTGYNVYRAPSEAGPWTKVNASPLSTTEPLQYIDTTPGNLAGAFYKVSAVTANGSSTLESAFTDISQAANNLVLNPSFEKDDGTGQPAGWKLGSWGGDGTGGLTSDQKTDGSKAAYILTGATQRGAMMFHQGDQNLDPQDAMPVQPGVPIVEGMFGKFKDTISTWPLFFETALNVPGYTYWYPYKNNVDIGPWDTPGMTNGGGDTPWIWLANPGPIYPFEFSASTRLTVFWANDGLTTLGSSTAYADDVTYQVKSFGATGMVFGRIIDEQGNGIAGVTVKVGDKSVVTNGSDTFIIRDAPTGDQTLTISVPDKPDYTLPIKNYGGYRLQDPYVVTAPAVFTIRGTVYTPDGKPAANADVRLVQMDGTGTNPNQVTFWETTTDANGAYVFGDDINNVATPNKSAIVAHKKGYLSNRLVKQFGTSGWSVGNDITLIQPDGIVEIAKTSAAPTIDGNVNASEWAASQKIPFRITNSLSPLQTTAYALWDDTYLYFAFVFQEPNTAGIFMDPKVAMWGTPPYWNGHDISEIRLDPTNGAATGLGHEWWQIMTNAATPAWNYNVEDRAVASDIWGGDTKIDGLQAVSKIDAAGQKWTQEMRIPFASLSSHYGMVVTTPAVGDEWAISLARQRHQPEPVGEHYAFNNFLTDVGALAHFVTAITPPMKGDLNGDHLVNALDAQISLSIAAGLVKGDSDYMAVGDVNNDGKMDMSDTEKIIRKVNGKDNF